MLLASDPIAALRECLGAASSDPKFTINAVASSNNAILKPKAKGSKTSAAAAAKASSEAPVAAPVAAAAVVARADGSEPVQVSFCLDFASVCMSALPHPLPRLNVSLGVRARDGPCHDGIGVGRRAKLGGAGGNKGGREGEGASLLWEGGRG